MWEEIPCASPGGPLSQPFLSQSPAVELVTHSLQSPRLPTRHVFGPDSKAHQVPWQQEEGERVRDTNDSGFKAQLSQPRGSGLQEGLILHLLALPFVCTISCCQGGLLRLLGCCQRSCKPICRSPAVPGVWRTSLPLGLRCLLEPASAVPPLAEGCHEAWQEDVDRHNEGKPDALQEGGCWGLWLRWRMRPVPNWAPLGVFIKLDPGSLGYDMGMG